MTSVNVEVHRLPGTVLCQAWKIMTVLCANFLQGGPLSKDNLPKCLQKYLGKCRERKDFIQVLISKGEILNKVKAKFQL